MSLDSPICNYSRSPDHILIQPLDKIKNNKLRALFLQIQISVWGHYKNCFFSFNILVSILINLFVVYFPSATASLCCLLYVLLHILLYFIYMMFDNILWEFKDHNSCSHLNYGKHEWLNIYSEITRFYLLRITIFSWLLQYWLHVNSLNNCGNG